jgi:hypothetical protein
MVVPSAEASLPAGSFVFAALNQAITGTNALGQTRFMGTLTFAVYRESATGTLDFLYQYRDASGDPVEHVSTTDFGTFSANVTHLTTTAPTGFVLGTVTPTDATRNFSGVISFDTTIPGAIKPSETSQVFVIHTNATQIVPGTTSLIDGGIATVVTRGPTTAPEPATLTLFAGGLLGLGGLFGRRWKKGTAAAAA